MADQLFIVAEADDAVYKADALLESAAPAMEHSEVAHPNEPGMPQLDASTYSSQLFWLAIAFALLYLLISRSALPRIHEIVDKRRHRIERDLERAEQLTREAEKAKAGYEAIAAVSRQKSNAVIDTAIKENAKRQETALAKADEDVVAMLQKSEQALAEKRQTLQQELIHVSESVAQAVISELTGKQAQETDIKNAIAALN